MHLSTLRADPAEFVEYGLCLEPTKYPGRAYFQLAAETLWLTRLIG